MKKASLPENEEARLRELESLDILDSRPEKVFDELAKLASEVCETPIAFIALMDSARLWLKAKVGFEVTEAPRDITFCSHTMVQDDILIVPDAREDERFFDNPMVIDDPNVVFYAGVNLTTSNGFNLGTLCVVDRKARSIDKKQIKLLKILARQVVSQMEMRLKIGRLNKFSKMMEEIHYLKAKEIDEPSHLFVEYLQKGIDILDMEYGAISRVENGMYTVEQAIGPGLQVGPGTSYPLSDTYCHQIIKKDKTVTYRQVGKDPEMCKHPVYEKMKLESFIGTPIHFHDGVYGTLSYYSRRPKKEGFSHEDIKFVEILSHIIAKNYMIWIYGREQQAIMETLKQEKAKNQFIIDTINMAPEFIGIADAKTGETIYHNNAFNEMSSKVHAQGYKIADYHPQWAMDIIQKEGIPHAIKHRVWRGESAILDKENNEIPVLQTIVAQLDEMLEPKYFSTIMQDISVLKKLQAEVNIHKDRLDLAVSSANIGIWDWDVKRNTLFWNETMRDIYDIPVTSSDINFKTWFDNIYYDDQPKVKLAIEQALAGDKAFVIEFRVRRRGQKRFIKAEAKVFRDNNGKPVRMLGANWDITVAKNHELEMQASLSRFESLTSLSPIGIYVCDEQGKATYLNQRWLSMAGMDEAQALGDGWVKAIHHEDRDATFESWNKAAQEKQDYVFDMRFVNQRTGQICVVNSKATPLRNSKGQVFGYIGVNQDITKQKEIEKNLIEAKEQAQRTSEAKSFFLANMSHEIRTPLNSIVGLSDLLSLSRLDDEQKRYVSILQNSSEVLLNLINDVLDLSKIEAGQLKLEETEVNFIEMFDKLLQLFTWQVQEKRINLNYYIDPRITTSFLGDPCRINQIFINLLGNAFKFTLKGNITFSLLLNDSDPGPGHFLIKVEDTGIGVAPDKQGIIFDAFGQAETSTTRKFGGTGLGLAITKKLAHAMGGTIWIESEEGKGSTFFVSLKLKEIGICSLSNHNRPLSRAIVALVVSENQINLDILTKSLTSWRVKVIGTSTFESCDQILNTEPVEVIIIDGKLNQEHQDGIAFIKHINEKYLQRNLKLIQIRSDDVTSLNEIRNLGVEALMRPYRPKVLHAMLEHFVAGCPQKPNDHAQIKLDKNVEALMKLKLKILLVDDGINNRNLVMAYLRSFPFQISQAENGLVALEQLKEESFDLVLMDMQMPQMDGYTATSLFRQWEQQHSKGVRTPIIALTAYALHEELIKSFEIGCDDHLSKPLKKQTLLDAILKHCQQSNRRVKAA